MYNLLIERKYLNEIEMFQSTNKKLWIRLVFYTVVNLL